MSVRRVKLEFSPVRASIPVYMGVTGPRAMRIVGEISDGVLMNGFASCAYVRRPVEKIRAGCERAGRSIDEIDLAIGLVTSVDERAEIARDQVRPLISMCLSRFPNIARETGYGEGYLARVREKVSGGGLEAGAALISGEIVDDLAVAGTPERVRERIAEYREVGVQCPALFAWARISMRPWKPRQGVAVSVTSRVARRYGDGAVGGRRPRERRSSSPAFRHANPNLQEDDEIASDRRRRWGDLYGPRALRPRGRRDLHP